MLGMQLDYMRAWGESRLAIAEDDERGANLVEYILIVGFMALLVIGAVVLLRSRVEKKFSDAGS
ncbi:MAG: hypothetical protein WBD02_06320, partial [Acidimicrobiia bacterium]